MKDLVFVWLQYLLPQHLLSRLIGTLAETQISWIRQPLIRWFSKRYNISLEQAVISDIDQFENFNQFFTRELKAGSRPVDGGEASFTSPADGVVSQFGKIEDGVLIQAKGKSFTAQQILACEPELANVFKGGSFATVYLSPSDYHRVHMPFDGTLEQMTFVPGKLFSVNDATTRHVPELFARNERVVAIFDTPKGKLAMVLVGAMVVASIETVWAGEVAPVRQRLQHFHYSESQKWRFAKGEEMGRFKLGSTVVMLAENPDVLWEESLNAGDFVQMGQKLADIS